MILRLAVMTDRSSWGGDCIPLIKHRYFLQTYGWDSELKTHRWFTLPVVEFNELSTEEQLQASLDILKLKEKQNAVEEVHKQATTQKGG